MTERTVEATWLGGYRCDVDAGDKTIAVDEPASVGGTDEGPQPTDLLLASVASCFTLALAHSAKKRSVEVGHLKVTVTGRYDGPRFDAIDIRADIDCDPAEVDRLVAAAERVCYVTNTLRSAPDITVSAEATGTVDEPTGSL